jgi:PIN domain nuclease of toxin-antitoxin system
LTYIFDACALLALLNKEMRKGYEPVNDLLDRAGTGEISLCMSMVNLVEVYYRIIQIKGFENADVAMEFVRTLPIKIISDITDEIYFETARYKARYPMSLGDAFLCGTAKILAAVIVTKDKDIKYAEEAESLSVLWIQ